MQESALLVRILGSILCTAGIIVCWKLSQKNFSHLPPAKRMLPGGLIVSVVALWKAFAFLGLAMIPAATVTTANYHIIESTHKVDGCAACHVMLPFVNDMHDPFSDTLAARHYKKRWISKDQCYQCHADYGFAGDFEAKMTGFRHLARYTTKTFHEPIAGRTPFKNRNCLKCHADSPQFAAISSHKAVGKLLASNAMSCLNCHGKPHPTREQRTPGSQDYARFMETLK